MPVRRKLTRRRRIAGASRRSSLRSRRRRSGMKLIGRGVPTGGPDRLPVKLEYAESAGYASALPNGLTYNANSIFDPQNTATGWVGIAGQQSNSQAFLRDQWAAIYGYYRVYACKIDAEFINLSATPVIITLYPDDTPYTSLASTDIILGSSRPYAKKGTLTSNAAGGRLRLKHFLPIWKMVGEKPQYVKTDNNYQAAMGGSPPFAAYYNFLVDSADGVTAMNFVINVRLTYYLVLNNILRDQAGS